jgi:hypothetical protein
MVSVSHIVNDKKISNVMPSKHDSGNNAYFSGQQTTLHTTREPPVSFLFFPREYHCTTTFRKSSNTMSTSPFSPPPLPLSLKPHSFRRLKKTTNQNKKALRNRDFSFFCLVRYLKGTPKTHPPLGSRVCFQSFLAKKKKKKKKKKTGPLPATLLENKELPPNLTAHRNRVFSFFCLATPRSKRPLPATLLENKDLPPNLIAHRNRVFSFFYLATPRRIKTNHQKVSEALPKLSFLPSRP